MDILKSKSEIGVIVSVYNGARYLEPCLESLLEQDFPRNKYFILVIDDGSTDNTGAILASYQSRADLTVIRNKVNKGLVFSLNRALPLVNAEFIIRFDADDIASKNMLSQLSANIGDTAFCHPYMYVFYQDSIKDNFLYKVSDLSSFFASGVLFRSEVISKYGYSNLFWEEFDLFLNILEGGYCYKILDKPLLYHRVHPENMTASKDKFVQGYKQLLDKWGEAALSRYSFDFNSLWDSYEYYFKKREPAYENRDNR